MLAGRTAVVTGAGNGIGRAIALDLARNGVEVIGVGRTHETLEGTLRTAINESLQVTIRECDVSAPDAVAALADDPACADVSILVNNAGVAGPVKPLVEIEPSEWDETFSINVRGVYLMSRAFLPRMIARGDGDIVNLASVSGKRPLPNRTPYCASKMAVIGLTTTLAWEVGQSGVRVNSISPGPVAGPRIDGVLSAAAEQTGRTFEEVSDEFLSRTALHRMLTEDEIAAGVRLVLQAGGLTAADIDLSAGMVAR